MSATGMNLRATPMALHLGKALFRRILAMVSLTLFTWMAWSAMHFPKSLNTADVGPGEFPLIVAVGGLLCSLAVLVQGCSIREGSEAASMDVARAWSVAGAVLVIGAYGLLMPLLGFYACTAVAVPVMLLLGGERKWLRLLLVTVGFLVFVYFCFDRLLDVQFP